MSLLWNRPVQTAACLAFASLLLIGPAAFAQNNAPVWTPVDASYNFAYAPSPSQTVNAPQGPYKFYFLDTITPATPGYECLNSIPGLSFCGIPDQELPPSGGPCSWNQAGSGMAPPYWYFDNSGSLQLLSGTIIRQVPAIGAVYASQQPADRFRGIQFLASLNRAGQVSPANTTGAMYFASNPCVSGDLEYGFAYVNCSPPNCYSYAGTQYPNNIIFYYSANTNCPSAGSTYGCYLVEAEPPSHEVQACGGAVSFLVQPNSNPGDSQDYTYYYSAWTFLNSANGAYEIAFSLTDPYDGSTPIECVGNPRANASTGWGQSPQWRASSTCTYAPVDGPATGFELIYEADDTCSPYFPVRTLYDTPGSVIVGLVNGDNAAGPPTDAIALQVAEQGIKIGK